MRCVIQRVTKASVCVQGEQVGQIGKGYCALLGVQKGDTHADARYMAEKIRKLRVFEDEAGRMNLSLEQVGGEVLAVSQFTLLGDARGQNRPGFTLAEAPQSANALYLEVVETLRAQNIHVETGRFQTDMQVSLINDGPVTILLDSRKEF